MFGLNDTTTQSNDDPAMLDNVKQLASEPAENIGYAQPSNDPVTPLQQQTNDTDTADSATASTSESPQGFSMDTPQQTSQQPTDQSTTDTTTSVPVADATFSMNDPSSTAVSPAIPQPATPASSDDNVSSDTSGPVAPQPQEPVGVEAPDPEHLAGLKQQALSHLEPLTEHLDGDPEEVFKTTMMMIQANDNHTLLEKALESAKNISDDKERAQAMLDIINEINYFAQNSQQQ